MGAALVYIDESVGGSSDLSFEALLSDVTQILQAIGAGRNQAAGELLPLVYQELRKLAQQRLSGESPNQTLQATALVHEAYLRLVGQGDPGWQGRGHFFSAAADAMRRILIENARAKGRLKRGGDRLRVELLDQADSLAEAPDLLLSLDELLTRLSAEDANAAQISHLHLFGGLSVEQAGDLLEISRPVAYRNWRYARAWLREALEK